MLSLAIGSSIIPIDPGISLPLVLRSPLFATSESRIPGSYIFNMNIPAGDAIRREFSQAHRVASHGRATAEVPYLIRNGILRYSGMCIVTQADDSNYEIAFKVNNGDFAGKIKDKTLKDLNLASAITIADVASAAHLGTPFIPSTEAYQNYYELPISLFDIIDIDISGRFLFSGSVFLAAHDYIVNHRITIEKRITIGSLKLKVYLNEVLTISEVLTGDAFFELDTTWNFNVGDQVRIELFACSEYISGWFYDLAVNLVTSIFTTPVIFDTVVTEGQDTRDYTIFPILNTKFLDNFPDDAFMLDNLSIKTLYSEYFKTLNYYVNGKFPILLFGKAEDEMFVAGNLFTPFVYMSTLLREIGILTGMRIINSPFDDDTQFKGAVLFNAFSENTYAGQSLSVLTLNPTFNLIDHVPEMKLNDFLTWISILTGYMPVIDNNELTITFVKVSEAHIESGTNQALPFPGIFMANPRVKVDPEYKGIKFELKKASTDAYLSSRIKELSDKLVYKGAVAHINNLPPTGNTVNDMYLVTATNEFYVWQYNPEVYALTWWFFSRDWPLLYTEGQEPYLTLTTEFSPVLTTYISDETPGAPAGRLWTIPVTEQPGILEGFPESLGSEYGVQMLLYKGMSVDSLDEYYPLGTTRPVDYPSPPDFPNINARDLFTSQYSKFLKWLAYDTKPVTYRAILTPAQLHRLQLWRIYRSGTFSLLIKEIRVNMLYDGLSVAEMDIYTC
jgi:hypothetical protein